MQRKWLLILSLCIGNLRTTGLRRSTGGLLLGVWLLLAGCVSTRGSKERFYFVQMSDTQFGFFNENRSFEKETAHLQRAIAAINQLKPAFVVVTGDLINKPFDNAQIAEYKRVTAQLASRIPLYNVAGNHDVGNSPAPVDIAAYNKEFGPDYYTFRYRSLLGIVLNSLYLKDPRNVPAQALAQEQWLVQTLKEAKAQSYKHIVVFLHHPLFLGHEDEAEQYFNIPPAARKKYLEIFRNNGIRYTFAGHLHRNAYAKAGRKKW
ncbi:MAG: metallophosphoesterase [Bacteroidota bacterium]|nr:metallophosphoesterase [Bacteroidota bacterium]